MTTLQTASALEMALLDTFKAIIAALNAEVPFLYVHPDNKSDGLVLCHRKLGQTVGARATDVAEVRETGVLKRVPIMLNSESYLCDHRWDWIHIGPLTPATLAEPVIQALHMMTPDDWHCVLLAINAQQYKHISNTRSITEERKLEDNIKRTMIYRYDERLHTQTENCRRDTVRADKSGHFTTDKRRNTLRADEKGIATW